MERLCSSSVSAFSCGGCYYQFFYNYHPPASVDITWPPSGCRVNNSIKKRNNVPIKALSPLPYYSSTCLAISPCNGKPPNDNCNYNSLNKFIANCTPSTDTGTESTDTGLQDSSSFPAVDCVGTGQDVECAVSSSSSEETQQQRTVGVELIQQQLQEWTVLVSPFFFWGTSMVAMKEVLPKAGPFFVSSFRLIPAGFLLIAFAASRGRPFPSGLTAWLSIALFGLVDAACFQGFLAEGLQRTSAGLGSVIIDSQPLTVAILAALFLGESIAFLGAAGLVLGIIGLLLLEAPSLSVDGSNFSLWQSGEWWMLLAAQSMAVGTIMVRWVSKYSDPIMATGWHMVIGGLPLVMISILNRENAVSGSLMNFTENDALALLYTSIFGSAISYGVYFYSATKGSLTKLSSLTFLTPMFASIFGYLYLGETFSPLQLVGAIITIVAIYMVNYKTTVE